MTGSGGTAGNRASKWLILAAVLAVAVGLRVFKLGAWPLAGDEIFTLRDSLHHYSLSGPKPLLFFLNHHLVDAWRPLDELGLRLLPALFGIAAVPGMYFAVRPVLGVRTALLTATLTALAPWHVYWSQFARYYSLVFFFTGVSAFLLYVGVTERRMSTLLGSLALWPLAVLAHPSAAMVLGAVSLWAVWEFRQELREAAALGRSQLLIAAGLGLGLLAAGIWKFGPVLRQWFVWDHSWGHGPLALTLSYADHLTLPVAILAVAGTVWMYREDRGLAAFIIVGVTLPVGAASVLTLGVPVSTGYLFATLPFVLVAAAYLLDQAWQRAIDNGTVVRYAVICLGLTVLADSGVRLVAHYQDGGRPDFRAAARLIDVRAEAGDVVVSDQRDVTRHYLSADLPVQPFFRTDTMLDVGRGNDPTRNSPNGSADRASRRRGSVWLVVEIRRRGGFNEKDLGPAVEWVWDRCRQVGAFGSPRLDYKVNRVRVYRCPASQRQIHDGG